MDPEKLPKNFDQVTYWATWLISLAVTGCNGFLQLFKLDKDLLQLLNGCRTIKNRRMATFWIIG